MKISSFLICAALALFATPAASPTTVLFIGNSFTFGAGSPVQKWRPELVTDLNHEGIGGVPALFKTFTRQAGLAYDVSLETHPGVGLDWHLQNRHDALVSRPWDVVVMHGQSTLDFDAPGNPAKLVATTKQMADLLVSVNSKVEIHLTATWPRADQTYPETGHWHGQPIGAMARDVRTGYDKAKTTSPAIKSVIPVGDAWIRAFDSGVADPNPYDGITPGQIDLWTKDHYHASAEGYYLEALMAFGDLTGRDPRSLGDGECSAFELGMSVAEVKALQQVAFDQLSVTKKPQTTSNRRSQTAPARCSY
ncbi:MAG TPA: SGNH/GDSL hydrolase family protein [Vicinamibacterales bacterium]